MNRTINLRDLRPKLPQVIDAIDTRMDRFIVLRHGDPKAIMMGIDDYEGLLETLDILQDKAGIKRLKKAEKEVAEGRVRTLEEIDRKLGRV